MLADIRFRQYFPWTTSRVPRKVGVKVCRLTSLCGPLLRPDDILNGEVVMSTTLKTCGFFVFSCLMLVDLAAHGQNVSYATQPNSGNTTPAMRYFGHGHRSPVARHRSRQNVPSAQRFQLAGGKPFQNINRRPTISPYLSLDTVQSSVGLPNYYSRVLPQIQQQEANQAQASELRRLQQQIRLSKAPGSISNNRNGGVPTTGRSTQFLNNGGYYPSIRR